MFLTARFNNDGFNSCSVEFFSVKIFQNVLCIQLCVHTYILQTEKVTAGQHQAHHKKTLKRMFHLKRPEKISDAHVNTYGLSHSADTPVSFCLIKYVEML